MKKNFLVAFISILIISTMAYATSYVIHDYDTGIMHMAQDIYLTNTNSVQTQIDSIETNLNGSYALKSGTLSQFTGGTNLNQIATRNHSDLQNLNATSAHPSASIDNTSTSYGKGLSTTDNTVQKVADRVNQNGTPQFVTDKTKCSLLLDFKGTLADRSRAINPIGSDAANKWTDGYVNDGTTKTSATNISCTLKQFDGDEGLFGSGVAVEESRTNLFTYSEDLTNAAWTKTNCTATLDRILPDGRKLFKVTVTSNGTAYIKQNITPTAVTHTLSVFCLNTQIADLDLIDNKGNTYYNNMYGNLTKYYGTKTLVAEDTAFIIAYATNAIAGQSFYITSPQLEVGAFPTSYIATGATAVTRPAGKLSYSPSILPITAGSMSCKVKTADIAQYRCLLYAYNISTSKSSIYAYFNNSDKTLKIYNNNAIAIDYDFTSIGFADYIDIVITWSGTAIKLYANGNLLSQGTYTPVIPDALAIGCNPGNEVENINGTISNFAIFNYALTADEISQIYNSGLEGKPIAITNPETIIPVGQSLYDTLFVTYASGWAISSTYPNKPTFSNHDGVAMLRGIVEFAGVVNSDVTLFTLPVGARPSLPDTYYNSFIVSSRDSGAPSARILRVYGNGDVVLMANGATITNPAISLDGINYVNGK